MSKLMYSCEEAARLSSRAMEQPLAPTERILLRMHLMMCKGCTGFAQQIEFLRRASRKIPEVLEKDAD
ncbi:MAG: zf-HC2 domain-containing protein [Burkholderiales bacterium]|nr:zf-HC2 domain-containing protein [Burkholderiales bacterium]MCJ7838642.1 zf-HC2 domain-containing protein [Burkholderiales bacterium]